MERGMLSITFRNKSPEEIIELVKKSGLSAIEWGGDIHVPHGDVATAKRVGELTREAGLNIGAYGSYYNCLPDDVSFDDVLASARALGAKVIRVWAGTKNFDVASEEEREQIYSALRYAVEQSAKYGITVATELHINTLTDKPDGLIKMLDSVPGLKTYWQQSSYKLTPDEECEVIKRLGKSIVNAHINYWVDGVQHPLAEISDRLAKYIPALEQFTDAHAFMIEFVKDANVEQFFEDAKVLLNA